MRSAVVLTLATCLAATPAMADKSLAVDENLDPSVIELGHDAKGQVLEALRALPYWLPLYPGAKANMTSAAQKSPDSVTVLISFDTQADPEKITAFYAEQLARPKLGKVEKSIGSGTYNLYVEGPDAKETCDVTITSGEDGEPGNVMLNYYSSK